MQYLISFLEGIVTFISPCLLPMLPVYVTYFAGGGQRTARRTLGCAAGFVLGFTVLFVAMGALAGTVGSFLTRWQTAVNIVCGLVVAVFGLDFLGVLRLDLFRGQRRAAQVGQHRLAVHQDVKVAGGGRRAAAGLLAGQVIGELGRGGRSFQLGQMQR